ncbi:MAG: dTDP-4-amino-4,6-dideoxygalactose transaminase [Planctomycetes bacterium]|nr:dTDP-4-amino-4,6-dideoxygalactose transaminase [Planctomycetota bacterium]
MPSQNIPFNKPCFEGKELVYIAEAINQGHISGDGMFSRKCSEYLEAILGCKKALLTTSCTHALEMSALLLDLQPGDEVIVPSFTFVSTANAFALHGAKIVFADIRPDTLNMDETQLESLITPRTRAIVPVHYAGVGCEMNTIMEIANRHHIPVIEDNAHGLFARYHNRYLGTLGQMSTLSFHETKNFTCGEGGALLLNEPSYIPRAEIIREKGTNRSQFFRGQVDKYTWRDIGSSYLPSDMLAGFLYAQLEEREHIMEHRSKIWNRYHTGLKEWASQKGVYLPYVSVHCEQSFHMFYMVMHSLHERQAFIEFMKSQGVYCVFHYLPLHLSVMGQKYGAKPGDCPISEDISNRLVRLPFYNKLSKENMDYIIENILLF